MPAENVYYRLEPPGWKSIVDYIVAVAPAGTLIGEVGEKDGRLYCAFRLPDGIDQDTKANFLYLMATKKSQSGRVCMECGTSGSLRIHNQRLRVLCTKCFSLEGSSQSASKEPKPDPGPMLEFPEEERIEFMDEGVAVAE